MHSGLANESLPNEFNVALSALHSIAQIDEQVAADKNAANLQVWRAGGRLLRRAANGEVEAEVVADAKKCAACRMM